MAALRSMCQSKILVQTFFFCFLTDEFPQWFKKNRILVRGYAQKQSHDTRDVTKKKKNLSVPVPIKKFEWKKILHRKRVE